MRHEQLICSIAEKLNIPRGTEELELQWKARVIYSAIGHVALASLFDRREDDEPISVQHLKGRIQELYQGYLSVYPEVSSIYTMDAHAFSDDMYQSMQAAGLFYESPYRIHATPFYTAVCGQTVFMRGGAPSVKCFRSGLGAYRPKEDGDAGKTLDELYQLPKEDLETAWNRLCKTAKWKEPTDFEAAEFLNLRPSRSIFFHTEPTKGTVASLARIPTRNSHLYYLYRFQAERMEISRLPDWVITADGLSGIASMCLFSAGMLPPIQIHSDGELTQVKTACPLPRSVQSLFGLYSWPSIWKDRFSFFHSTISTIVITEIRNQLEKKGFCFQEV